MATWAFYPDVDRWTEEQASGPVPYPQRHLPGVVVGILKIGNALGLLPR